MARVQVGYNPRPEGLQTTAAPNVLTEKVRFDPRESSAFQLAEALGSPSVQQALASMSERVNEKEKEKARAYAGSMTVEQLGQQIKEGKILQSQSPIYAATVQHIYGENSLAAIERDTVSKMERGELKFNNQAELDDYLQKQRNQALEGQSDYAVAGFDKRWNQFRETLSTANTRILDKNYVEYGTQQAQDNLTSILQEVKGKPPAEAAAEITKRYQLLRKTSILKDDQGKEALVGLLTQAAADGNVDLVNELAKTKLDNGVTIGAVVGAKSMVVIQNSAMGQLDKNERQRVDVEVRPFVEWADKGELTGKNRDAFDAWVTKNEKYVTAGTIHAITNAQRAAEDRLEREGEQAQILALAQQSQQEAQQVVSASIAAGTYAFQPQLKVVNPSTGQLDDFKQKDFAVSEINKRIAQDNIPFPQQVMLWSTNGLQNPDWEKQVQAGISNIASVGWTYDGKNIGQLNPQGQAAIQRYLEIAAVNPAEAEKYAGSKENQRLLSDIQFMMEKGGKPNISDAAAFVNQANRRGIESQDSALKRDAVNAAVDDIVNPGFFSGAVNWVSTLFGGNEEVNLTAIASDVRRRSELLVMSGQVPDAKAAVKATVEYFSNPAVTSKINNTVYFNKDLPAVPKGHSPSEWMERFIKEVPGKIATDQQIDGSRIRLEPNTTGGFTAWIAGVPVTNKDGQVLNYTKDEISKWISTTNESDLRSRTISINEKNEYEAWSKRVRQEYVDSTSTPYGSTAAMAYLTSPGAFKYFKQQGVLDKSPSELGKILKQKGK